MTKSLRDMWVEEADRAIQATSERLAQDLFRSDPTVKIYSEGAANAEPTWVGTCKKCRYRYITNLHWPTRSKMPDRCDRPNLGAFMGGMLCGGEVEHDPDSDALLAVYLLHGYEAIQDRPRVDMGTPSHSGLADWLPKGALR